MAKSNLDFGIYINFLRRLREVVLPKAENARMVLLSITKGASIALYVVIAVTIFISAIAGMYGYFTDAPIEFSTLIRGAFATALSGFGGSVSVTNTQILPTSSVDGLVTALTLGAHSGLILVIAFFAIRSASKDVSRRNADKEALQVSPIHVALGFTLFSWLVGFVAQGPINYLESFDLQPLSLTSVLALFAVSLLASYSGKIAGTNSAATPFGQIAQWVSRTFSTFVLSYSVLTVIALIVAAISIWIEPVFAYATAPTEATQSNLSQGQVVLGLAVFVLFVLNGLFQGLLAAMGLNVGMHWDSVAGGASLIPADFMAGNQSFWLLTNFGVWSFVGALLLVLLTALVSGAAARSKTGLGFRGQSNFLQALGYGSVVAFVVTYVMNIQVTAQLSNGVGAEASQVSSTLEIGTTFVSVLVIATLVLSAAFLASERIFTFISSAFPLLTVKIPTGLPIEERTTSGRVFGIITKLALLAVVLTPITAATTNRVWASTSDNPSNVAATAIKNLKSMPLAEFKTYLNAKGLKTQWLPDKVLEAARPTETDTPETDTPKVTILNNLGGPWQVGNLDAGITVEFDNPNSEVPAVWKISTESELTNPSWLIKHPVFSEVLSSQLIKIAKSPLLKDVKKFDIKINGQKVAIGSYQGVPGFYKIEAPGYKLVAPTTEIYSTEDAIANFVTGSSIQLPAGGDKSLNTKTKLKASRCLKLTKTGGSGCFTSTSVIDDAHITTGTAPKTYFDSKDTGFKSSDLKCDSANRADKLITATKIDSTTHCNLKVAFTRTYFDSKDKRVPHYVTKEYCDGGAYLDDYGNVASYEDYDYYYDENYYVAGGRYYWESQLNYDGCYYKGQRQVQSGWDIIQVRGKAISSAQLQSTMIFAKKVTGVLNRKNVLIVK